VFDSCIFANVDLAMHVKTTWDDIGTSWDETVSTIIRDKHGSDGTMISNNPFGYLG
jgi:hypothetical protein